MGSCPAAPSSCASTKEQERILEVVTDVGAGRTLLLPIWDPSPAYVLKLGRLAAERAAADVVLPPPLHLPVPEEALVDWYRSVAQHLTEPLYAWHHPRFGNALTLRLLERLAAETKVAGVLDASGDLHRLTRNVVIGDQNVVVSDTLAPSNPGRLRHWPPAQRIPARYAP